MSPLAEGVGFGCGAIGGVLSCWGGNASGQLASGDANDSLTTPEAVVGVDGVLSLAANNASACAIDSKGALFCWGDNSEGQIGDGTRNNRFVPTRVKF